MEGPSPIESLPNELLIAIFQRVSDDRHLLKSCALVCKRWNQVLDWRFWNSRLVSDTNPYANEYRRLFEMHPALRENSAMLSVERPLGRNLLGNDVGNVSVVQGLNEVELYPPSLDTDWHNGSSWIIEEPGSEHSQCTVPVLASSYSKGKIRSAFKFKSFEKLSQLGAVGCKFKVEASTRFDCGGEVTLTIGIGHDDPADLTSGGHITSETLAAGTDWTWIETNPPLPFYPFLDPNQMLKFEICCRDRNFWRGHYGPKIKRIHVSLHCWTAYSVCQDFDFWNRPKLEGFGINLRRRSKVFEGLRTANF